MDIPAGDDGRELAGSLTSLVPSARYGTEIDLRGTDHALVHESANLLVRENLVRATS